MSLRRDRLCIGDFHRNDQSSRVSRRSAVTKETRQVRYSSMIPSDDRRIQALLKSSMPPPGDAELRRDLWLDMLKRIESEGSRLVRFGPVDWIITAAIAVAIVAFPSLIP